MHPRVSRSNVATACGVWVSLVQSVRPGVSALGTLACGKCPSSGQKSLRGTGRRGFAGRWGLGRQAD